MITAFTGKNSYALNFELKSIIDKAKKELGDVSVERFDASETEVDILLQSVQSLPFLAPKKLIIIDNAQSNSALMNRIDEFINRTPETVDLVLVGPVFDKRKSSYTTLKKNAKIQEFFELDPKVLPRWIIDEAKSHGAKINTTEATYLIERIGTNQLLLTKEIEKMSLYSQNITKNVIDELTNQSAQSTIFSLLDAAFAGDKEKAIDLYREQRQQKIDPHYIIAMLTWQLQGLAMAIFANPQTESELISAGISPFTARKSLTLAKKVGKSDLRKLVVELSNLDLQIKTNADADASLELYLLNI
jgi:DNA polymerase III subunit delta